MILLPILALIILAFVAVFVYTKWCKKAKSRYSTTNTEGVLEMGNVDQVNYPYTQRGEGGESEGKEGAVREVQTGTETDRQTDRKSYGYSRTFMCGTSSILHHQQIYPPSSREAFFLLAALKSGCVSNKHKGDIKLKR